MCSKLCTIFCFQLKKSNASLCYNDKSVSAVQRGGPLWYSIRNNPTKQTKLLYAFFWVIPRRLNFICRRFGTLRLFHLHMRVSMGISSYQASHEDGREGSETAAYKTQTSGNHPEESIQHSEHGESLK
jgi:hypothetical protein